MKTDELGAYVLIEQIAVGGMAEIYLAKTRGVAGFEKFLCLKVIHPNFADDEQFIEMLIDEAKIAVGLNHVNIAQIFDLGHDAKTYFIAMEYIDGADLFKIMRSLSERDVEVPVDTAVFIAQEICTGLDYAHRKRDESGKPLGIIHRDISPQNILISNSGEVKIIDFGIAKAASRSRKTQAGVIKGKYYYMSPEQAWGDQVDHRSDIFSAGIILYEVLTGQMLYLEEDVAVLMEMVRRAEIPRPTRRRPDIPPQLENVVMKALAKRPEDRWQSANDFQVALTGFLYSYAPDFTPERLANTLKQALEGAEGQEEEEEEYEELDDSDFIVHVEEEQLMSRVDYAPASENSVIFNIKDVAPNGFGDEDDDGGEKTTVSTMPQMMEAGPDPEVAVVSPFQQNPGYGQWDDDGPTLVARDEEEMVQASAAHQEQRQHELVVGQQAPVSLPPRVGPPGAIGANTEEKTLPTLDQQPRPTTPLPAPPPQQQPPQQQPPQQQAGQNQLATPRSPAELGQTAQSWAQQQPPVGSEGTDQGLQGSDSEQNLRYTGGAFAERLAARGQTPATPSSGRHPTGPPVPQATGEPDPWELARQQADARYKSTSPEAFAHTQQASLPPVAPARTEPISEPQQQPMPFPTQVPGPPPGQAPGPGPIPVPTGPMDPTVQDQLDQQLTMQPSGRSWWKVLLAMILVTGTLGGIGAGVFLFVRQPEPETGFIEIVSVPPGATAHFASKPLDERTPVMVPVEDLLAEHQVKVTLKGYQPWQEKVSFPKGYTRLRVLAVLSPVYGKVLVRSLPSGATIYIKGESYGRTPATVENLSTQEDLTIELRLNRYAPTSRTMRWEGESYLEVEIPLEKEK